jgi:hypothetical protein
MYKTLNKKYEKLKTILEVNTKSLSLFSSNFAKILQFDEQQKKEMTYLKIEENGNMEEYLRQLIRLAH